MPPKTHKVPTPQTHRRALTLDVEHYRSMLDAPELSDKHQREMIEALWSLIVSFVDLDYEILLENSCGEPPNGTGAAPNQAHSVLKSHYTQSTQPAVSANNCAAPQPPKEAK